MDTSAGGGMATTMVQPHGGPDSPLNRNPVEAGGDSNNTSMNNYPYPGAGGGGFGGFPPHNPYGGGGGYPMHPSAAAAAYQQHAAAAAAAAAAMGGAGGPDPSYSGPGRMPFGMQQGGRGGGNPGQGGPGQFPPYGAGGYGGDQGYYPQQHNRMKQMQQHQEDRPSRVRMEGRIMTRTSTSQEFISRFAMV